MKEKNANKRQTTTRIKHENSNNQKRAVINFNELRASLRNYWKSENHELKFVIRSFLYSFLNF